MRAKPDQQLPLTESRASNLIVLVKICRISVLVSIGENGIIAHLDFRRSTIVSIYRNSCMILHQKRLIYFSAPFFYVWQSKVKIYSSKSQEVQ